MLIFKFGFYCFDLSCFGSEDVAPEDTRSAPSIACVTAVKPFLHLHEEALSTQITYLDSPNTKTFCSKNILLSQLYCNGTEA